MLDTTDARPISPSMTIEPAQAPKVRVTGYDETGLYHDMVVDAEVVYDMLVQFLESHAGS